ncbi:Gfa-like protein [hydrothermal vent metagenome]|uniref:Gfa-like protein n=1 Tax=hydrothermal vent metagenome TaxID=652676 RepID=A0A3B0UGX1_9ZZZZ
MSELLTGGCQCGAIRFSLSERGRASICHCRMCQKAFGGLFAPLVSANDGRWTRGEPKWFQSSNAARRAFCSDCGTPLAYETRFGLELAVGAFDKPDEVAPLIQVNLNDKLTCYDGLSALPIKKQPGQEWVEFLGDVQSYQHPDHETEGWTFEGQDNGR